MDTSLGVQISQEAVEALSAAVKLTNDFKHIQTLCRLRGFFEEMHEDFTNKAAKELLQQ